MNLGSNEKKNISKLSAFDSGIAGAISGFITRALLQPLDVLKIRFQLQVEPTRGKNGGLYHGIFQATKTIIKQEGGTALWKGHVSAQVLTITYGMGQFGSFAFFKNQANSLNLKENGLVLTVCGGLAGMMGTLISMPFDVARTRIIAQSIPKYTGMLDVWKKMLAKEKLPSLWKGLMPTLLMTVPFTAIQFRMYYFLSSLPSIDIFEKTNLFGFDIAKPALCGAASGLCAKIIVHPLDVLKKRMQIRGSEDVRRNFGKVVFYRNMFDCIQKVTLSEGFLAWYKGLKPSLIKSAAFSALVFSFYELSCDTILSYRK